MIPLQDIEYDVYEVWLGHNAEARTGRRGRLSADHKTIRLYGSRGRPGRKISVPFDILNFFWVQEGNKPFRQARA